MKTQGPKQTRETSNSEPDFYEKLLVLSLILLIVTVLGSCKKKEERVTLQVQTYTEHGSATLKYIDAERNWHTETVGASDTRTIEMLEADLTSHVTLSSTWTGLTDSARIVVYRGSIKVVDAIRTQGYAAEVTVQPSEMK